jgi:sugar phosphate isomerase/epimerase
MRIEHIPLISVGFDGYGLDQALEHLARTGSRAVCLCALDEFTQHVLPEEGDRETWAHVKALCDDRGVRLYGLEGHTDVSNPENLGKIKKRMEFTRFMGGRYMDSCAGPAGGEAAFLRNIQEIAEYAEELDLLFCLETHGDIIGPGKSAARVLKQVPSRKVGLCYDPANVFFYSRGAVDPVEDLKYALEFVQLMHFKGVGYDETAGEWRFPSMADAAFPYDDLFRVLEKNRYQGMVALEIEIMIRYRDGAGFVKDARWRPEAIVEAYRKELQFLSTRLGWMV